MSSDLDQLHFDFDAAPRRGDGYTRWQMQRAEALRQLARQLGLPLGHRAEVILRDGIRLVGDLRPAEDNLWVEPTRNPHVLLRIDRCTFTPADIESCVRLD